MSQRISSQEALPEGSQRVIGRDAMRLNIAIAYAIAQIIKTTLGPKGMDKMLVSDLGDITITNDGATILEEMNIEHPTAKLMVEIAKTQDKEVGDGTTTSVVIAGNLLKNAGQLLDKGIHPTTIVRGFELGEAKASEELKKIAKKVTLKDKEPLVRIANVAMGSKGIGSDEEKKKIAELVVNSVMKVVEEKDDKYVVDLDLVKLEKKEGADVMATALVEGIIIDKEVVHSGMPKLIENAKVALVDAALEIEKTEVDAKIEITSPDQLEAFLNKEEQMLKKKVDQIRETGANVVFVQKGIDDMAQHYLAKAKIMAVRRVKKSDMEKLARATGGKIATSLEDLSKDDLGNAGLVQEKKIAGESMVFVEKCKDPKSVTMFIRGGTEHVVNEVERAIKDSLGSVSSALEDGTYVTGGGSVEMKLAMKLREYASKVGGREQLAVEAFAEALESVPTTLAENAGMDSIDTLVELRTKHSGQDSNFGIDVMGGKLDDMGARGVLEPAKTKKQAISSATETARLVLRIDDIISAKGTSRAGPGGPGGMPPDME